MKVIVTGCTGLTGGELVKECIKNPAIEHIIALTRKPLSEAVTSHEKVTVILHEDFSSYPPELLSQLQGANGCLWAIGGRANQFPDVETARKVSVDYTLAAAKAFVDAKLAGEAKIFRMVFCSGWLAEWDQKKPLRFMEDSRKIKGQVEKGLADMADGQPEKFQSWFVRPGDIIPTNGSALRKMAASLSKGIVANKLAQAMIKVLLEGYDKRILEPADIQKVLA
ncbi:hypothetical protein GGTG_09301 [Gaeumannomyces tritici R3-111a-1]|uniref:Uncharacterized protein n=1 Tax=Gaeumannomyces tritici (strain R3-111a-1) TaxID=644352 RepID=J3P704_GAET3|nr:hypothetical protein GGTG_09301 [Gaeumannomyces tritici R3-111a-1]EJT72435.1 hypothetical protein GGTG_09301 [Gaeumannomyces tritici R3-111a-1]